MKAYVREGIGPGGGEEVEVAAKEELLWWQERGLSFTASGYGRSIPTRYKVFWNNRWRRVYCCIISNSGTCYIGKSIAAGHIVRQIEQ